MVNMTLPNLEERLELLGDRIKNLANYYKIADDVCPLEIAARTRNFTEDELCRLVSSAGAQALIRVPKPELEEGLQVGHVDFLAALKTIKPRFGVQHEELEELMPNGFIKYNQNSDLDNLLYVPGDGLSCQLIEGDPKSGVSTVAAQLALKSGFPFIKHISVSDLYELSDSEKCRHILNVLEDAYISQRSAVILDGLERILDYGALGMRYSNEILQMLMVILKKQPPRGHALLILCTTNRRDILQELGLLTVFTGEYHVPNLSTPDDIMAVMKALSRFEPEELQSIGGAMEGRHISIGIKRLLDLITWVNPLKPDRRPVKFLEKMGEIMGWTES
ncbi:vesicle-fusing ATPase 2 [Drosophila ficusphila]|uniref:vesicle-fusing ATPase 2 n=1 Tax=Drosophila ficusphila TaxID=30025 RepID=UPI0007E71645|nr:vesicle-fusing ATPase 2 [Drosophila ficusphila]